MRYCAIKVRLFQQTSNNSQPSLSFRVRNSFQTAWFGQLDSKHVCLLMLPARLESSCGFSRGLDLSFR